MTPIYMKFRTLLFVFLLVLVSASCSEDTDLILDSELEQELEQENEEETEEETEEENTEQTEEESGEETEEETETDTETTTCTNPLDFIFNEEDGLVLVEFENAEFSEDWKLKSDGNNHSGDGYMVWEGQQSLGNPGNGKATFKIKIVNTGVYQFLWNSAVKTGTNGTEHNDTWLRFNDADDFYGQKNEGASIVYPNGSGKTPNPEGASKEGWFKVYRSGSDIDFKWQARTSDNDAHEIFVKFDNPGTYLMEISARSSGHGIDKFVLFNDSVTKADAIASTQLSTISCD